MSKKRYRLGSGEVGVTPWIVYSPDGSVMARLEGPSSGVVALAAVERLNGDTGPFIWDGWVQRLGANTGLSKEDKRWAVHLWNSGMNIPQIGVQMGVPDSWLHFLSDLAAKAQPTGAFQSPVYLNPDDV